MWSPGSELGRTAGWSGRERNYRDRRSGQIVLPGFVNTHHHFYQTLTRVVPGAQDAVLFDWLKTLYPIWAELTQTTCLSAPNWR